ncbi:Uncharacterised protein [Chlamydia trachomatis]|nr:Uncharacterised protein [Chlamydia trachomatis]
MLWFFFDREAIACVVKLGHAIALWVAHPVAKHGGLATALGIGDSTREHCRETGTIEDVVAQHKAHRVVANKFLANDEALGKPVGRGLLGIGEPHAIVATIAKQSLKAGQVVWRGNNQNVANASQHEHRDGIIDHGFIKNGQQLLAHPLGDGIETSARTACQYNTFHAKNILIKVEHQACLGGI